MVAFGDKRYHLLATLLSLEGLIFSVFSLIFIARVTHPFLIPVLLVFLTLTVCEGALGLAILVSIVRATGTDNLEALTFLKC